MDTATSRLTTSAYMVLVGIGVGFSLQMANTIAQNSVELRDIGVSAAAKDAYFHAVSHGIQQIFLVGALCGAAGFLAAVFIQEVPLSGVAGTQAASGTQLAPADP